MLLKVALLLLLTWLVAVLAYEVGALAHVFLLGGLMLLLLAVIKGRDAAATHSDRPPKSKNP